MSAGLFTADTADPLWKSAHDILLPSFSTWAMKGYVDPMVDIAQQLMLKWERLNPDEPIDVAGDMTRLTLDTIALCGFGYRFNSFYRDTQHPFVQAMIDSLAESLKRQQMLPMQIKLRRGAQRRFLANAKFMDDTIDTIVKERRASGDPGTDLLGHMLVGTDKQGKTLPDHNIVAQCGTFLIAGHETTSGLLSFAIVYLLKHPDVVARAQEEVDRVLGTDPDAAPTVAQIGQLGYVRQILDETLRLWPTAPAFTRQPRNPGETVGGYGPFRPGDVDRRADPDAAPAPGGLGRGREGVQPGPHGTGAARRPAAQRLPAVRLRAAGVHRQAVRPPGGDPRPRDGPAALRAGRPRELPAEDQGDADREARGPHDHGAAPAGPDVGTGPASGAGRRRRTAARVPPGRRRGPPRHAAAGALRLESRRGGGPRHPDRPRRRRPRLHRPHRDALDDAVGELPTEGAVVVVTSSYNGEPPDNAGKFCTWLDGASASATGVRYTVFGCGNRDWAATYQAVPTRVDAGLEAKGGTRVYPRGEGDARGDFDAQFEDWYRGLWDGLGVALGLDASTTATATAGPRLAVQPRAAPHGEPGAAVLPGAGGEGAGQPRADRPGGHPGRALGAPPRDRAACRGDLRHR